MSGVGQRIVAEGAVRRRPRAVVGPLLLLVGAVHTAIAPVVYPASVRSILDGGVLASVQADPLRGVSFWYATAGLGLLALGWAVTEIERHGRPLPRALPWVLTGLGVWGIALMPASPFWVFPVLGLVAELRRRRSPSVVAG